ncbi:MAG TPA: glycosyltransferase family 39 protein, partial [Kamptonema sp.]|nr:glycosyltransferase family 39 protein [Kamptonema sp.]
MLKFLVIVLLIIGIFFRFTNLDRKVYSYDEAITSLRISGYTWTEMVKQDFQGKVISVADLQTKYQQINPEKNLINTIKGLAAEEPQLTPLYFTLSRFWVKLFGPKVAVTRSLSALISLLIFPSIYWLCLELFQSSLIGWIAIAIISVSPFHILYAQDARPYMLLAVTILLSSGALLRAIRLNTKTTWIIYAATLPLGLYSHLLFTLVAAAHGIYVIAIEKFQFTQKLRAYLVALTGGILTFSPWILVLILNAHEVRETVGLPQLSLSVLSSVNLWILMLGRIFLDTHWAGGVLKF